MEYSKWSCFIPEKSADFEKHFEEECTTITWEISKYDKRKTWLQIPEIWIKELMLPVLRAYFKAGAYPHVPSGGAGRLSTCTGTVAPFKFSMQSPVFSIHVVFRQWNLGLRILESYQFLKHCLQRFTALRRFSLSFCFLCGWDLWADWQPFWWVRFTITNVFVLDVWTFGR